MNPSLKKSLKYAYVFFALFFIIIMYGNTPLNVFLVGGGINLVILATGFFLVFTKMSERTWVNVLRFLSLAFLATFVWLSGSFFIPESRCLELTHVGLFENRFTKEVAQFDVMCGNHIAPWYYTAVSWSDPRNPDPTARHIIKLEL